MDVSDLRKRILRALDEARKESQSRRVAVDESTKAFAAVRDRAVSLLRQAQAVLRAEGHLFTMNAPVDGARLVSDASPQTFIEFTLDTGGAMPCVLGRVSLARGRQGVIVEERPVAPGKPVADVTEDDISAFLVGEIPKLIVRS
jgi:hypothetical protein